MTPPNEGMAPNLSPEEFAATQRRAVKCWLCRAPYRAEVERARRESGLTFQTLTGWIAVTHPDNRIGEAAIQRHFRDGHHERTTDS
jgi:hypothetical protein